MDETPTIPTFLTEHLSLATVKYDQLRNAIRAKLQRHGVSIDHFATCAAALDIGCCKDTVVNWLTGETKGISCKTAECLVTMFKLQIVITDAMTLDEKLTSDKVVDAFIADIDKETADE